MLSTCLPAGIRLLANAPCPALPLTLPADTRDPQACPMFALKGPVMKADTEHFAPAFPLKHAQKDMKLALLLADGIDKKIPHA